MTFGHSHLSAPLKTFLIEATMNREKNRLFEEMPEY
jgi:hypothetical protein